MPYHVKTNKAWVPVTIIHTEHRTEDFQCMEWLGNEWDRCSRITYEDVIQNNNGIIKSMVLIEDEWTYNHQVFHFCYLDVETVNGKLITFSINFSHAFNLAKAMKVHAETLVSPNIWLKEGF